MLIQTNTRIQNQDIQPILMRHELEVTYQSLLVRCNPATQVGSLALIGFDKAVADSIVESLQVPSEIIEELNKSELDPRGLYIVKTPEAYEAQHVLSSLTDVHYNGLARIICQSLEK